MTSGKLNKQVWGEPTYGCIQFILTSTQLGGMTFDWGAVTFLSPNIWLNM